MTIEALLWGVSKLRYPLPSTVPCPALGNDGGVRKGEPENAAGWEGAPVGDTGGDSVQELFAVPAWRPTM